MEKEKMRIQLEKLEEARKNYFYLYQETKDCLAEINPNIRPFLTIGRLDEFSVGKIDDVIGSIEKEMERYGVKWEKEQLETEEFVEEFEK